MDQSKPKHIFTKEPAESNQTKNGKGMLIIVFLKNSPINQFLNSFSQKTKGQEASPAIASTKCQSKSGGQC